MSFSLSRFYKTVMNCTISILHGCILMKPRRIYEAMNTLLIALTPAGVVKFLKALYKTMRIDITLGQLISWIL